MRPLMLLTDVYQILMLLPHFIK